MVLDDAFYLAGIFIACWCAYKCITWVCNWIEKVPEVDQAVRSAPVEGRVFVLTLVTRDRPKTQDELLVENLIEEINDRIGG